MAEKKRQYLSPEERIARDEERISRQRKALGERRAQEITDLLVQVAQFKSKAEVYLAKAQGALNKAHALAAQHGIDVEAQAQRLPSDLQVCYLSFIERD